MHEYTPAQERSSRIVIAMIALLVSIPLLIHAIYGAIYPEAVVTSGTYTPTFEQFKIETYERMTDRDLAFSGLNDDKALQESYNKISAKHWELVAHETRRELLIWGGLFLISLCWLLVLWYDARRAARFATSKVEV